MNTRDYASAVDALCDQVCKPGVWLPVVEALGITVNLTTLPCWKEYQKASNHHNCARWKKGLRRFFLPSVHAAYGQEFIKMQVRLQDEFLAAVMAATG